MAAFTDQRLMDLVRVMRAQLHAEDLITDEEYAFLASQRNTHERIASYDQLQKRTALLEAQQQRLLAELNELRGTEFPTMDNETGLQAITRFVTESKADLLKAARDGQPSGTFDCLLHVVSEGGESFTVDAEEVEQVMTRGTEAASTIDALRLQAAQLRLLLELLTDGPHDPRPAVRDAFATHEYHHAGCYALPYPEGRSGVCSCDCYPRKETKPDGRVSGGRYGIMYSEPQTLICEGDVSIAIASGDTRTEREQAAEKILKALQLLDGAK